MVAARTFILSFVSLDPEALLPKKLYPAHAKIALLLTGSRMNERLVIGSNYRMPMSAMLANVVIKLCLVLNVRFQRFITESCHSGHNNKDDM